MITIGDMDYERDYAISIENAKQLLNEGKISRECAEFIFPSLKESDDDRAIREISELIMMPNHKTEAEFHRRNELVDWFKKWCNKRDIGKVELREELYEHIRNACACMEDANCSDEELKPKWKQDRYDQAREDLRQAMEIISVERNDIDNAQPGDILVDECDSLEKPLIFILKDFKQTKHELSTLSDYHSYCYLKASRKQEFKINGWHNKHSVRYATMDEILLLFEKMYSEGYIWDAKNLTLRKFGRIARQSIGSVDEIVRGIENCICSCVNSIGTVKKVRYCDWLDSIKEIYISQLRQEWTEEGLLMIDEAIFFIREFQQSDRCKNENDMQNSVTCEKWLKSLKQ